MSKLKITEPNWEAYTGNLGSVEFVNGVSVDHVSPREAQRISGSMRAEFLESGLNPSITQVMIDAAERPAPMEGEPVVLVDANVPTAPAATAAQVWTKEELEVIGDSQGIKGLREVAEPLGIKDNSISGLIEQILSLNPTPVVAKEV